MTSQIVTSNDQPPVEAAVVFYPALLVGVPSPGAAWDTKALGRAPVPPPVALAQEILLAGGAPRAGPLADVIALLGDLPRAPAVLAINPVSIAFYGRFLRRTFQRIETLRLKKMKSDITSKY